MKYMILVHASQQGYDQMFGDDPSWRDEHQAGLEKAMTDMNADLEKSGEFIDAVGLAAPVHTRQVVLKDGVPVVTDGPYAETQEVLAGYWMVECDSFDRATEIAARLARAPGHDTAVHVRPVLGDEPAPEL